MNDAHYTYTCPVTTKQYTIVLNYSETWENDETHLSYCDITVEDAVSEETIYESPDVSYDLDPQDWESVLEYLQYTAKVIAVDFTKLKQELADAEQRVTESEQLVEQRLQELAPVLSLIPAASLRDAFFLLDKDVTDMRQVFWRVESSKHALQGVERKYREALQLSQHASAISTILGQ